MYEEKKVAECSHRTNFLISCWFKCDNRLGCGFKHPPPSNNRGEPGVRGHVPVSRVSVCLCDCFNIGFLSVVAWCSPPVVCRHREAWGTLQAMERDPFHPPPFIKKEQHGPVLCRGPLVQHTRDNQMIPFYTAY